MSTTEVRRWNNFSGDAFRSRTTLTIRAPKGASIDPQSQSREVILQQFKNHSSESTKEAQYYLNANDWNLAAAIEEWSSDKEWESAHAIELGGDLVRQRGTRLPSTHSARPDIVPAAALIVDGLYYKKANTRYSLEDNSLLTPLLARE